MNDLLHEHLEKVVDRTWNFAGRLKTEQDHILNAVLGLGGEAGEIIDLHKKMFYHTPKDRHQELIEETGDVCYYLAKLLDLYGLTLEEVLAANKKKLFERHGIKE